MGLSTKGENGNLHSRGLLILVSLGFILVTSGIIVVAGLPKAAGYETSIYSALPSYIWLLLVLPVLISCYVMVTCLQLPSGDRVRRRILYLSSAAAMAISFFTIVLMPFLRGYEFFNPGDSLTHLGHIFDIQLTGHIAGSNFYPAFHIWILDLSAIIGLEPHEVMMFVPQFFSLVYLGSMFLLARDFRLNAASTVLVMSLAALPVFGGEHLYAVPSAEAFFLLPLVLHIVIRSREVQGPSRIGYSISMLVFFVFLPFFHPEATLFLLIMLITLLVASRFFTDKGKELREGFRLGRLTNLYVPIATLATAFMAWFSASVAFGNTVRTVYDSLVLNIGTSPLMSYASLLQRANIQPLDLVSLFVFKYGLAVALIVSALVAIFMSLHEIRRGHPSSPWESALHALFVVLLASAVLFFVKDLTIGERSLKYALMISTLIVGSLYSIPVLRIYKKRKNAMWRILVATFLVSVIAASSLLSVFPSPGEKMPNLQVMKSDFSGMNFFLSKREESLQVLEITTSLPRYADAIMGVQADKQNIYSRDSLPPSHFHDAVNLSLGDFYSKDKYLLFNSLTYEFYPSLYPEFSSLWRYRPSDFVRLESDWSVNHIYSDGNVLVMYVTANRG